MYNGIPPTDPRILAMTEEQIDLEYAHLQADKKLREGNKEEFSDPSYEDWDKEVHEYDSKLSYEHAKPPAPQAEPKEEDWEDVETRDL